jgi:O-antigen/teichoic acid export membrane protein
MLKTFVLDRESLFDSSGRDASLAQKSIRGSAATLITQGVLFSLQMGGTILLARLLTPGDYGIIGMVAIVIGFAEIFRDAGLSTATIQNEQITHEQISSLFWVNTFIGIFLFVCLLSGAPLIGWFYKKPELIPVTAVLSLSFVLNGLAIQHLSLLQRHMRFGTIGIIRISSQAIALLIAIFLAYRGWHYWSLVGSSIVTAVAITLISFLFCPWLPGWIRKGIGSRKMLRYGGHLAGSNIINYFSRNGDNLLIGKFIGTDALGLYAKAYSLFFLPISQIRVPMNSVALPVLSTLKDQPERYIKYYQRFVDIMASLTMPLMTYCVFEADFLIRVILGSQWLGAIPVFRILAIAALIQPVYSTAHLVQLSYGYSKQFFILTCLSALVFVTSFIIGLPFGIEGVAAFYTAANYVLFFPTLKYCYRRTPITVSLFLKTISIPLGISIAAAGVSALVAWLIHDWLVKHLVFLLIYVAIIFGSYLFRKALRETIGLFAAEGAFHFIRTN